ncbi:MAG: phosphoribosyltransferase [Candidatus Methylomirabilota bacterium]
MLDRDEYYFTYADIHETVRRLAAELQASGFDPDVTVAIGTGGFIPARILRTYVRKPILTVGLAYYNMDNKPMEIPQKIQWIDEVQQKLEGKRILLVDEVDDSRATLEYCLRELLASQPREVAVMVLHNKRKPKKGQLPPGIRHYWAGEELEDRWIHYPWDALDIVAHEQQARQER